MKLWTTLLLLAAVSGALPAEAASGTGRLDLTVHAGGTITFTIESVAGSSPTGLGTANATTAWGTVSRFGPPPTAPGLTRSLYSSHWELAGTIGFKVAKANLNSSSCYITAQLTTAQVSGQSLRVNVILLNSTSPTNIGPFAYDTVLIKNIRFEFKYTLSAPVVFNNTINFIATSQ